MKLATESASKIKSYKACPFKYYLEYHLGLDMGSNFAAEQGSMAHVIFEQFGEAKRDGIAKPKILTTWYDEILWAYGKENLWKLSKDALARDKACNGCPMHREGRCRIADSPVDKFDGCPKPEFDDAVWLVEKVIKDTTKQSPLNKKIVDVERRFEIEIIDGEEKVPVVGIMDVAVELDPKTLEIVDYKTGKHIQSYNECTHDPQLLIYHLAARRVYTKYRNILVTIYYLRRKPITLSFSPNDEKATEAALCRYWYTIRSDQSPKRRCDRNDGTVEYDHVCKYLCKPEICMKHYRDFVANGNLVLPPGEHTKEKHQWCKHLRESQIEESSND